MSDDARMVLDSIGSGMRLRVPHDGGGAELREGFHLDREPVAVAAPIVRVLLDSGLLFKLTEEPAGSRLGWRAAGYDGDVADWYVMVI